ncbi:hypothetical protein CVV65_15075 [Kyrpidia spormannii]|uniref:Uncharacterized protein n=1 Tax=Kyrpidia spormannii TaxID=2055160 RepID=A0A2K8N9Q7_9BACL|nr:hypothetical protein [Kyrpidia spormannii]ATY86086.1 hypothetical protein CVV65_15075 [Kyrpidia spormannii]
MADIISLMSAEGYRGRHKGYSWSEIFAAMQYRTVLELEVMGIEEHELNGENIRCWVLDFGEGVKEIVPRMESGVEGNQMLDFVGKQIGSWC